MIFPELHNVLGLYAARALHSTSQLSCYTENVGAFKFWLSTSGKTNGARAPSLPSGWLFSTHVAQKLVMWWLLFISQKEWKESKEALKNFTLRITRSDITGTGDEEQCYWFIKSSHDWNYWSCRTKFGLRAAFCHQVSFHACPSCLFTLIWKHCLSRHIPWLHIKP